MGETLKRELLRLLREDEEFRLAVAGLVGLESILRELKSLREDHAKRFEAIERKLLEHDKRFEAIERKLLEHDKKFEEHSRRFEEIIEEIRRIQEEIKKIWSTIEELLKGLRGLEKRVSRLEENVGALAESMYSKFTFEMILEEARSRGERLVLWRRNARVDDVDVDLLVETDRTAYVVEVKVRPRIADVREVKYKAERVSKALGKRAVPIITGTRVGRKVEEAARENGVLVYAW
ncbi:MAG: hypothetical protein F7B17_02660 [Desulfurococcales archaeon]|nr:hypothetical protein [Desulfurococcales archaeon]